MKRRIARRLTLWIIIFSSVVTLLITALQLYRDYQHELILIDARMQQIQDVNLRTLSNSLWVFDKTEMKVQLEGILQLPDMQYLEIKEQKQILVSVGIPIANQVIEHSFPLHYQYQGEDLTIGTLTAAANLRGVYQRLIEKTIVILISNAISTFLVAAFILLMFQYLVTRHLVKIADFAQAQDINKLDTLLTLNRKDQGYSDNDEIGIATLAINRMQSNLKASIAALKESEAQFRVTFNQAAVGIAHVDTHGYFIRVNPKTCDITGYSKNELIQLRFQDLTYPNDAHNDEQQFTRLKNGDIESYATEKRYIRKDQQVIWVNLTISLLRNETGEPKYFVFVLQDIGHRKQTEAELAEYRKHLESMVAKRTQELETLNGELQSFSYSISHDLRAPLRHISGFSLALQEDYAEILDEAGHEYINRLRNSVSGMNELIEGLLILSRATQGELLLEELDLRELALQAVHRLQQINPSRNVSITMPEQLKGLGDKRLLPIVFDNLLGNAWKYTSKTPNAKIELGQKNADDVIVYYIRDNGAGFNMDYADKLFGAFQRLHNKDEFEGHGIGLATVARIIHRHSGQIWAEGKENEGAVFYFTLGESSS